MYAVPSLAPILRSAMNRLPASLVELLQRQRERLHEAAKGVDLPRQGPTAEALDRILIASDYALDGLCRQPGLIHTLDATEPELRLAPNQDEAWSGQLRRYRHAESVRLIHRDVNGIDTLEQTLAGTSALADRCIDTALAAAHASLVESHGEPRDGTGAAQRLIVFGLGKLGGQELNFSSDVDLVFAFPANGASDGRRSLDNPTWFRRLGQRLIQILDEVTAAGMAYRVDMRLRPFGQAGRLALSLPAMEQYFQSEGRDWERYAWIKARPVAGDLEAGTRFLDTLRPFVYRRYLDFGAITGLREMKAMIEAEVQRQDRVADLKLGHGGIREIEFIVQLQQLIRGGREPNLRQRSLLPALARLREHGHIPPGRADALARAYVFLRHLENRLQMLREEQTHTLSEDPLDQARLAWGLGFADAEALQDSLDHHRQRVNEEFVRVFEARARPSANQVDTSTTQLTALWRTPDAPDVAERLEQAGFVPGITLAEHLRTLAQAAQRAGVSNRARQRLNRVLPALLALAAASAAPVETAERGLVLMQTILRRSSYLALLDERPAALTRLVDVLASSRWMAERLCSHPLLLDELLDARVDARPPTRGEVDEALDYALAGLPDDDLEARIHALNEFRQGFAFRVARAFLVDGQPAAECTRQLAIVAEAVVGAILPMAQAEVARRHGVLPGRGLAVIAYGSFGGKELGLGSDLDLVFLHDGGDAGQYSDGAQPLDAVRYHTRVVQKVIALLAVPTPAGSLYEADLRLRPDGGKGPLVSSLDAFAAYQHERAWIWEQQALVRARAVAGEADIATAFARVRAQVLGLRREADDVIGAVVEMRQRMRAELDRSGAGRLDLKQGEGGLVDLEFLVQAGVLLHAWQHPEILTHARTPELIDTLAGCGFFAADMAGRLQAAHALICTRLLACTLNAQMRVVEIDEALAAARQSITAAWRACMTTMEGSHT